ncbi:DUF1127 domain-containing protein [Methylobacterium sp. JK268]
MATLAGGEGNLRLVPVMPLRHTRPPRAVSLMERIELWMQRRRQRLDLQQLPDGMLKDLGLSHADVAREAEKPFWRA